MPSAPVLTACPSRTTAPGTWLELSRTALAANLALLRGLLPVSCGLMAVLKSEAYGHGLVEVADLCWQHGVRSFGVTHLREAQILRQRWPLADITLIGPFLTDWAEPVLQDDLQVQLSDLSALEALGRTAAAMGRTGRFSIKYDSGMARLGCSDAELPLLLAATRMQPALQLRGLVSHFACADHADPTPTQRQLDRFQAAIARARGLGFQLPCNHIANSAAALRFPTAHLDQVRCGIALYGLPPAPALRQDPIAGGLRPLLRGLARVVQVHEVAPGQGVGYGHRWCATRPSRIGIVPLGYADGYRRLAGDERRGMEANGAWLPVVGQVCMNMTMLDLTDAPAVGADSVVTWLSDDPASPLSAEALANAWGTIPYEVVTGLSGLLPRLTPACESAFGSHGFNVKQG